MERVFAREPGLCGRQAKTKTMKSEQQQKKCPQVPKKKRKKKKEKEKEKEKKRKPKFEAIAFNRNEAVTQDFLRVGDEEAQEESRFRSRFSDLIQSSISA